MVYFCFEFQFRWRERVFGWKYDFEMKFTKLVRRVFRTEQDDVPFRQTFGVADSKRKDFVGFESFSDFSEFFSETLRP